MPLTAVMAGGSQWRAGKLKVPSYENRFIMLVKSYFKYIYPVKLSSKNRIKRSYQRKVFLYKINKK